MKAPQLKPLPVGLFALALAINVVAVVLSVGLEDLYNTLLFAVLGLAWGVAGTLVASRAPDHRMGWLFLAFALLNVLTDLAQGWGLRAAHEGWPGAAVGYWIETWSWQLSGVGGAMIFLLFPDGRLPSRRWRIVPWLGALALLFAIPGRGLNPITNPEFPSGRNPLAVESLPTDTLLMVGMTFLLAFMGASILALVVRFRRSRGIERQQLKWFALVALSMVPTLPLSFFFWFDSPLIRLALITQLTALPIAACVAILRYRLYAVDAVISRTLVYGTLTLALAAAFGTTTLVLGALLGSGSPWTVAASTLVAAAAFRPLRARLQDAVDRVL